jgi:hypothetical protein
MISIVSPDDSMIQNTNEDVDFILGGGEAICEGLGGPRSLLTLERLRRMMLTMMQLIIEFFLVD